MEPAMTRRAYDARLIEHQRGYQLGRIFLPLQQMQVKRKGESRQAGKEPGREESHLMTASGLGGQIRAGDGGIEKARFHEGLSAVNYSPRGAERTPIINELVQSTPDSGNS